MKRFLTGMLCAGILTSQPAVTYDAETESVFGFFLSSSFSDPFLGVMIADYACQ